MVIEFVDVRCDSIKLSTLRHALQNEVEFAKNNMNPAIFDERYMKEKFQRESETDFSMD